MKISLVPGWMLAALLFSGCATSGGAAVAAGGAEQPLTGEIRCAFAGASFNDARVVGPKVNMTRRSDGSWGGTMQDQAIDADDKNGKLSGGANLTLVTKKEGNKLIITGQFKNRILRYEISDSLISIRTDARSVDYPRTGPGAFGYAGEVRFLGDAEKVPNSPAFTLAVVSAFF